MNPDIHRLLDEAFAGVEMTPEAQDLKEEIRANLVARVDELEASGVAPAAAAARAIAELGDVREMLGEPQPAAAEGPDAAPRRGYDYAEIARNRVRPKPAFVVRTVVLSIAAAAAAVLFVLTLFGIVPGGLGGALGFGLVFSAALGIVTGDGLHQETTSNHPLPVGRAVGFGAGTFGVLTAVVFAVAFAVNLGQIWLVVVAALLLVASIALLSWLGATQTNRHKAWTRHMHENMPPNRFEEHPEVAARFGIYTAVIWVLTFVVIAVLVFTVGWWWAPVAFVAGFAVMMLVLARMMFGRSDKSDR
jgi:MFS family permease